MKQCFQFLFQRFGAFLAPLTSGRVTIASCAIYSAKVHVSAVLSSVRINLTILTKILNMWQVGLAVAIRYSLSRRTFSAVATGPEVLLLDYPSHQRRLLPLLAKT